MFYFWWVDSTLFHLIALSHVPKVGPILGRVLVGYCGSPEAVFQEKVGTLAKIPQIGLIIARFIQDKSCLQKAENEICILDKEDITAIHYLDKRYPSRLSYFDESPLVLFMRGAPNLQHPRTVGIIGTRTPSPAGRIHTQELVEALVPYNAMIMSGLAHGVDSTAHQAALAHGLPTIGVLGHGLHTLYPAAHRGLAQRMTGSSGILTEFPFDTIPDRENFPMRNRIIAAWSDALVVVESKEKGGSMITAEYANRYNKDVFAIPGRVQDAQSKGCHLLIKRHKAHLMETVDDLVEIMGWENKKGGNGGTQVPLFLDLNPEEKAVVETLKEHPEIMIDKLGFQLQMPASNISAILLNLEFKGVVRSLPGKRYILSTV
ncbi:MAG: DNA-processing protein DprA [Saprospiraceae bacterium]|nr:DNA-processing protein DprA [Saprospiraceae bacterium]